jgi:phage baseplate assembly protein W
MSYGVSFPLAYATGSVGYLEPTNDIVSALQSNVRCLLLTNWGERVMHADMGGNFRGFLFEPMTNTLRAAVAARVKQQLSKWLPFLTLTGLTVTFSSEDASISDPGFRVEMAMSYGNVPVNLSLLYPPS